MYTSYDLSHCARGLFASNQRAMLPRFVHTHTHTREHKRMHVHLYFSPSLLLSYCSISARCCSRVNGKNAALHADDEL